MLQQTQVDRVIPKWEAFMSRFPTVESCAAGSVSKVIGLWDGLGYNRRAVMLHQAATRVNDDFAGVFPTTVAELQALPGIGPYTSRAIIAFTGRGDAAPLDTNIGRILARLAGRRFTNPEAQKQVDGLVPTGQAWEWNQTLMDFGAGVCTKRDPACETCPVKELCAWRGQGADPAEKSAGVSGGQSRFVGSDRQGRGRLVAALRNGPVPRAAVAETMGWPDDPDRADRVLATLVKDSLVKVSATEVTLPR